MKIKIINNGSKITYELMRDSWKELFRFEVGWDFKYSNNFHIPRGFIKTGKYITCSIDIYWLFPFYPFIKLKNKLSDWWWKLARYFYRKGYIKREEGEVMSWFWPSKIRFKKYGTK